MRKDIVTFYGRDANLDMLMEEAAELIRACNKVKRADGKGYASDMDAKAAKKRLIRELAHTTNAMNSVMYLMAIPAEALREEIRKSDGETEKRMRK